MNKIAFVLLFFASFALADQNTTYIQGPALISSTNSIVSAAGTTVLTKSDSTNQQITGSMIQTIVLPDATTLKIGREFYFSNRSSGVVTIQYNDASTAIVLQSGDQALLIVESISTANGVFDVSALPSPLPIPLPVADGGTGSTSFTPNSVIFMGASALSEAPSNLTWNGSTLNAVGTIQSIESTTDSGGSAGVFQATSNTTVNGSNTTIGINGTATGLVQAGAENDKTVAGMNFVVTRGDGTDQGLLDDMNGVNVLMFSNPDAAGVTHNTFGVSSIDFSLNGTQDNLYDFYALRVPAGPGVVTNHYGIYVENDSTTPVQNWLSGTLLVGGSSYSPTTGSVLDIQSTTGALILPRMSAADEAAIPSPSAGMTVYNTDSNTFDCYTTMWSGCGGASFNPSAMTVDLTWLSSGSGQTRTLGGTNETGSTNADSITVQAPNSQDGTGGAATLNGGNASGTGIGGEVDIVAGNSGNNVGGRVLIVAGSSSSSATGGDLTFHAGTSTGGTDGSINLRTGNVNFNSAVKITSPDTQLLSAGNSVSQSLSFYDSGTTNYESFKAPNSLSGITNWTLPDGDGSANQVLKTDGAGILSWATVGAGTVTSVAATVPAFLSVSGSPVTTSGTLAIGLSGSALPVANGGTSATSYTAPSGNIDPIIFYNGTKLATDATVTNLGYDPTGIIEYGPQEILSSAALAVISSTSTAAQSTTNGSRISIISDPGAAFTSGNKIGQLTFGGSKDSSHTINSPVGIGAFATEAWGTSATGAKMTLETTANGATTRTTAVTIDSTQRVGFGVASPSAVLMIKAGTATTSTAPLKFTSGTNLTTPEDGAMEYDGSHLYVDISTTRYQLDQQAAAAAKYFPPVSTKFITSSPTYNMSHYFTVTSASATVGATYTNNSITYTVFATIASSTTLIMTGNGDPTASGTLTKTGGTGDSTITFSAFKSPLYTRIFMLGAGAGGGGSGTGGGSGGLSHTTTVGSSFLTADGGGTGSAGGAGGAAGVAPTIPSSVILNYASGGGAGGAGAGTGAAGGMGGASCRGGAGGNGAGGASAGLAAAANSGSGGGGAGTTTTPSASGGGSGACIDVSVPNTGTQTYAISVGGGGAGGIAGTGGQAGGAGADGVVYMTDYYQ